MKIGIFGDSFATKYSTDQIWWRLLQTKYNHEVECFGESGSSIMYSIRKLFAHSYQFDFQILCLTTVGRYSVALDQSNTKFLHLHQTDVNNKTLSPENQQRLQILEQYKKIISDQWEEILIGTALVNFLLEKFPNLMIIPCFNCPLDRQFNLFKISQMELNFYFPGLESEKIFAKYADLRPAHLTNQNNEILADQIDKNLHPGIFQIEPSLFVQPSEHVDKYFKVLK